MTKQSLRQEKLKLMKSFQSNSYKVESDHYLAEHLYQTSEYKNAKRIGIVLSMPHEVDTYSIIEHMLNDGKIVFVPETDYEHCRMSFKALSHLESIGPDVKGINHVTVEADITNQLDLLVVPGVVFNTIGYRIGYGGGYFDKFLSFYKQSTISLLYDFQLDDFEVESHDEPVEKLIIATTK